MNISHVSENKELEIARGYNTNLPSIYKDSNNHTHQFNHLKAKTYHAFETLMKFIAPDANLTSTPTLIKRKGPHLNIRILNFTKDHFTLDEKKTLRVNETYIFVFHNCFAIAYSVNTVPEIICFEVHLHKKEMPEQRSFLFKSTNVYKLGNSAFLGRAVGDEPLLGQIPMEIKEPENFIKTNSGMTLLNKKIAREAVFSKTPSIIQFPTRNGLYKTTICNHTTTSITFDIQGCLRINGEVFSRFVTGGMQFIAYHIKDCPEIICIENKLENEVNLNPRLYAELSWKPTSEMYCIGKFKKIHKDWAFETLGTALFDKECSFKRFAIPKEIIGEIATKYLQLLFNDLYRQAL